MIIDVTRQIENENNTCFFVGNFEEESGILNEDRFYNDNNYSIHMDPDRNRGKGFYLDPYFKVYDAENEPKAKHCARISLKDFRIIHHVGKPELKITNPILKWIINALESPTNNKKYLGLTTREAMIQFLKDDCSQYGLTEDDIDNIFTDDNSKMRKSKK